MRQHSAEQLQFPHQEGGHAQVKDHHHEAHGVVAAGHHDARHGEHGADGVYRQHDAALVKARLHQAVVDVALVGLADGNVLAPAADDRRKRVQHGNARDDHRHGHRRQRGHPHDAHQRHDAQQKAQRQRAAIAHEQLGRVEVEPQKRQAHRHAHDGHKRRGGNPVHQRQHEVRAERDGADARGQAVQAVDEVDDVGKRHQPEHRQRPGEYAQVHEARNARQADLRQHDARRRHDDAGGNLAEQLVQRADLEDVVDAADEEHEQHADEHAPHVDVGRGHQLAREDVHAAQRVREGQRDDDAAEDGDAAHARGGVRVDAPLAGQVDRAQLLGDDRGGVHEHIRDGKRHDGHEEHYQRQAHA